MRKARLPSKQKTILKNEAVKALPKKQMESFESNNTFVKYFPSSTDVLQCRCERRRALQLIERKSGIPATQYLLLKQTK